MVQNLFKVILIYSLLDTVDRETSLCRVYRQGAHRRQRQGGHGALEVPDPQWEKAQPPRVIQGCPRLTLTMAMPPFGPLRIRVVLSWALKGE